MRGLQTKQPGQDMAVLTQRFKTWLVKCHCLLCVCETFRLWLSPSDTYTHEYNEAKHDTGLIRSSEWR